MFFIEIALKSEIKSLRGFLTKVLKRASEMKLISPHDIPKSLLISSPASKQQQQQQQLEEEQQDNRESVAKNNAATIAAYEEQIQHLKTALQTLEQERTHYQDQVSFDYVF